MELEELILWELLVVDKLRAREGSLCTTILLIAEAQIGFKVLAHKYSTSKNSNSKTMILLLFQD
jgi:hypothetical protein